ncbi:alpha/beta hydrolase [Roseomonas sp. 18066]|uniref:alpha/beta hydrolase n=1 Tax=Roseomonas sp. 18066 TaxID=2681412 RepID=UPI0013574E0F|nr:alpha/beta hydrolase [Roseomonas sp. 18066]
MSLALLAGVQEAQGQAGGGSAANAQGSEMSGTTATALHLGPDSSLGQLLDHPGFTGFAPLLLPWDGRSYDRALRLRDIGSLLPYHSHVEPTVVASGLNRLIDEVARGAVVFHRFYSEAEQQADPAKANTGLFLLRGRPGAPFAVIAPGGGFAYVGAVHEGFPYAEAISQAGYNAFVLRYRTGGGGAVATEDLAAALSYVLRNAGALGVGAAGYSLWGSSAGARMAASIGSHGTAAFGGEPLPGPAAVIMAYTAHADHAAREPPTFVVVGDEDRIAPPSAMARRVQALSAQGSLVQFHRYPGVGHGFGTGAGTVAEGWIGEAIAFWQAQLATADDGKTGKAQ